MVLRKPKPYLGVAGATTVEEVEEVAHIFKEQGFTLDSKVIPMMGFLMSRKQLQKGETPGMPHRYVTTDMLPELLEAAKGKVWPTVHYNGYSIPDLRKIFSDTGIYQDGLCQALQINNKGWPTEHDISVITKEKFPGMKIIFQLSKSMLRDVGSQGQGQYLVAAYPNVEYMLVDPSGGKGQPMNPSASANLGRIIDQNVRRDAQVRVGFAGGLGPENVREMINELGKRRCTNFPIDAESALRTDDDTSLDMDKVAAYISEATAMKAYC